LTRRSLSLPCLVLLFAGTEVLAQSSLKSRRDFTVGDHPVWIVVGDFDGDGNLDFLTDDQVGSTLTLLKGFGDGTFRKLKNIDTGSQPAATVFVDVNNDGKGDFVTCNHLSRDVTVNLGDGAGNFGTKIRTLVGVNPDFLAVGDWNGDGKPDIATINALQTSMAILLGDGTGSFITPARLYTVGATPVQVVSADFNRDGKLDLAVVNNAANNIQIWLGDGTGQFAVGNTISTGSGSSPVFMAAADLNGDGIVDIAVSNSTAETVAIYLGTGTGAFGSPTNLSPGGFGPQAIAVTDINKDGKVDLLVTLGEISGSGQVAEMLGTGGGAFGPPSVVNTGPQPKAVAVGDFNKDGNLDAVTANNTGNNISVLQNVGAGAFLVANKISVPSGSFPAAVAVADFNGDHKPDVVIANEFVNTVSVTTGDCLGNFATVSSAGTVGITPLAMAVADFNGDTDIDVITANNGDNTFSILQNSGTASFTVTNGLTVGLTCDSVVDVALGDVSGDGRPDAAFVCEGAPSVLCTILGTGGSGSAAFGPPLCTQVGTAASPTTLEGVSLGNLNLDALMDPALSSRSFNAVEVGISNGSGGLLDIPAQFAVGVGPSGSAIADMNHDGFNDIIVADTGGSSVSVLLGDGGGVFSIPSFDAPAGLAPTAVAIADFNLDGNMDVAAVNTNGNDVSLLLGDGLGHLTNVGTFGVRDQPLAIAAGDFNCDGKPDLAVADNFTDTVTILFNQSMNTDPLQTTSVIGSNSGAFVVKWGIVPGAVYDVIRGQVRSIIPGTTTNNLGPVTCYANDLTVNDTATLPDASLPPLGDAYFYLVRSEVNGVGGQYTVSSSGKPGVPSSGDCP
jgi:VCBS repeat protein